MMQTLEIEGKRVSKAPPIVWCHWDCVDATDERIPLCKHFSRGNCMYTDSCAFRHVLPPSSSATPSDRPRTRHGSWQRRKIFNEGKCGALRRWLLDTFGEDYLRSGSGVLDVAGGKGEFSFELCNLNSVPSTVVDPRPMCLRRYRRKLRFGYYHRNDALQKYNSSPPPMKSCEEDSWLRPRHLRVFFEVQSEPLMPLALASDETFAASLRRAVEVSWTGKGLTHEDGEECDCEECAEGDSGRGEDDGSGLSGGTEILDIEEARAVVEKCSLVVGLHPDQAAGHIADFCLARGLPFAIVPCCVYKRQFPHRRLPSGRPVSEYADLVEFLLAKDPETVRAVELDFEGKNVLVYSLGLREAVVQPGSR